MTGLCWSLLVFVGQASSCPLGLVGLWKDIEVDFIVLVGSVLPSGPWPVSF